jgi:hypothetical protein
LNLDYTTFPFLHFGIFIRKILNPAKGLQNVTSEAKIIELHGIGGIQVF